MRCTQGYSKDETNPDTCLLHIIHEANINKIEIQWFEMNKQICSQWVLLFHLLSFFFSSSSSNDPQIYLGLEGKKLALVQSRYKISTDCLSMYLFT